MKHKSNIALVIAAIALVAGILITGICIIITGGLFSYSWNFGEGPVIDHFAFFDTRWSEDYEAKRGEQSGEADVVTLDSFSGVDIGVTSANVTLIPSDENKIEYKLSAHERVKKCEVNSKGILEFKANSGISIFSFGFGFSESYVKVYYNAAELDDVSIATVSGNINTPDIKGDIFNFAAVSGNIMTGNLVGDTLNVTATSGEIDIGIADISGNIQASNTSGDIKLRKITDCEILNASTVSGEIIINECAKIDKTKISTVSSDIVISGDFGEATFNTTSGGIEANSTRDGDDYRVTTSTVSGDCRVEGNEIKNSWGNGAMRIDCGTVSGDIEVNFNR